MTGKDFAATLLDESGYQFRACLKGISEENFTATPLPGIMSIRESLQHCTEACIAVQQAAIGEKHNWGTYAFPAGSISDLISIFEAQRTKAVSIALAKFEEDSHYVKDYLVAHEFYHVGQMCSVRMALNDGFEPYSIYRF